MKRGTTDRKKENIEANKETTCVLFNNSQLITVFTRAGYSFLLHFTKLHLIYISHFNIIFPTAPMPSKRLFDSDLPTTPRIFLVCQVLYHFSLCGVTTARKILLFQCHSVTFLSPVQVQISFTAYYSRKQFLRRCLNLTDNISCKATDKSVHLYECSDRRREERV